MTEVDVTYHQCRSVGKLEKVVTLFLKGQIGNRT